MRGDGPVSAWWEFIIGLGILSRLRCLGEHRKLPAANAFWTFSTQLQCMCYFTCVLHRWRVKILFGGPGAESEGLGDGSPRAESRGGAPVWGLGAKPPEAEI